MTILANKGLAYGTLRGRGILRDGLPPSGPPIWTLTEETSYYSQAMEWVAAIPGTDAVTAFRAFSSSEGVKRIDPDGAGTETWSYTYGNMEASGTRRGQAENTEDYCFAGVRAGSTYYLLKLDATTGAAVWKKAVANAAYGVCLNSDATVGFSDAGGTNRLRKFDPQSMSAPSTTNYTLTGDGSGIDDVLITKDDSALVSTYVTSGKQYISVRWMSGDPGSGAWSADLVYDASADFSTPWATGTVEAWLAHTRAAPFDAVWIASTNYATVYKVSTASKSELVAIDLLADLGFTAGVCRGIETDTAGNLYAILEGTTPNETHVLMYDNDGVFVTSTQLQGITLAGARQPQDITVTDLGSIVIANDAGNGYYTRITQS